MKIRLSLLIILFFFTSFFSFGQEDKDMKAKNVSSLVKDYLNKNYPG